MALTDKLTSIANAIRNKTGLEDKLTLDQMVENVDGIDVMPETVILVDEDGVEIPAVFTDEIVEITATANDIRLGTTAITNEGIITGEKVIPAYHTTEGVQLIPAGSALKIPMMDNKCEYTKLQVIVCSFNTDPSDSVAADKVSIEGNVYSVNSVAVLSVVKSNIDNKEIDLGLSNESDTPCVLRYFTYKEEY